MKPHRRLLLMYVARAFVLFCVCVCVFLCLWFVFFYRGRSVHCSSGANAAATYVGSRTFTFLFRRPCSIGLLFFCHADSAPPSTIPHTYHVEIRLHSPAPPPPSLFHDFFRTSRGPAPASPGPRPAPPSREINGRRQRTVRRSKRGQSRTPT